MSSKELPSPRNLEEARAQLREHAARLAALENGLQRLAESLRSDDFEPEDEDAATEILAVVDCVLLDSIGPAKRDLLAAADYSGKDEADAGEEDR